MKFLFVVLFSLLSLTIYPQNSRKTNNFSKSKFNKTDYPTDVAEYGIGNGSGTGGGNGGGNGNGNGSGGGGNSVPISNGMWILILGSSYYFYRKIKKEVK